MSTRSNIIAKTKEGYKVIYCHSDGYPEMAALRGGLLLAFVKINDKINIWTKTNTPLNWGIFLHL